MRWSALSCVVATMAAFPSLGCRADAAAPVPSQKTEAGAEEGDLCAGLVQDKKAYPMSPLPKPAIRVAVEDPEFGTTIRRIGAAAATDGENAVVKPMYSTVQAWNADESRLVLWQRGRGHVLFDGRTYRFLGPLDLVSPTDLEQLLWDPVDPDVLYYPSNYNAVPNLMRYRVSTGRSEVLTRFSFCPVDWGHPLSLGSDPMYLSWGPEARVLGLMCGDEKFLYDVVSGAVVARTSAPGQVAPQPGPGGERVYWWGKVYDDRLRLVHDLNLANPGEHASLGRSAKSGHDLFLSVIFDPPPGGSPRQEVGSLVQFDMETGERRVIIGFATGFPYPASGTHVSAVSHQRPGWAVVSSVGDPRGRDLLQSEIVLANLDTGEVCRVAHHRSFAGEGRWGYWAEPHPVISPSGTRILFASDWGNGPTVDTFVVELPSYEAEPSDTPG